MDGVRGYKTYSLSRMTLPRSSTPSKSRNPANFKLSAITPWGKTEVVTQQASEMVQAAGPKLSFDQFLAQYPDNGGRYELVEGEVVAVRPTGAHEDIGGFIALKLGVLIDQEQLPLKIPRTCVVRPDRPNAGYIPDVAVLYQDKLGTEPLWEKASTVCHGTTVKLAVEVVSTNWRDDYGLKLADYEAMGIEEYWIVDFRALGAARVIGQPKQPTLTICTLGDDGYQLHRFTGSAPLQSQAFPNLTLTAEQVFRAGTYTDQR